MKIYFVALRFAFSVLTLLIVLLSDFQKSNPPGSVGTSLALETIIQHSPVDFRPIFGLFVCWIDFCLFDFFSSFFVAEMKLAAVFLFVQREEGVYWQNAWN